MHILNTLQEFCRSLIILMITTAGIGRLQAQSLTSLSPDGRYFAIMEWVSDTLLETQGYGAYRVPYSRNIKSSTYVINVYDLEKRQRIQKVRFTVKDEPPPDTLVLSPYAQNFYFRMKYHYFVFHTRTGKLAGDYYYPDRETIYRLTRQGAFSPEYYIHQDIIAFPSQDNLFLVRRASQLLAVEAQSGEVLNVYTGFSRNVYSAALEFTSDDNYIVMKDTRRRFYIWKTGHKRILKRLTGKELRVSADNRKMIFHKSYSKSFYVDTYLLPSGTRGARISKYSLFREFPPPVPSKKIMVYYPGKQEYNLATLSPTGKYLLVGIVNDRLSDLYMIFDVESEQLLDHFEERRPDKKGVKVNWISDHQIEIQENQKISRIYSVPLSGSPLRVDLDIPDIPENLKPAISLRKMRKNRDVTVGKNFVLFPFDYANTQGFILKNTRSQNQESLIVNGYRFHSFTPDGNEMVLISPDSIPLKISVSKLFENRQIPDGYIKGFDNEIKMVTEDWVKEDGNAPEGYTYYRIDSILPFGEMQQAVSINIIKKSINFNDSVITLHAHLMDNVGHYFSGASADNKYIWCGLFVRKPDGTLVEIENFTVDEYSENTNLSNAVSVVMDHSGSMGYERAYEIQKGAKFFIEAKSEQDGLALIKYDHYIGIESQLDNDARQLMKRLGFSGLSGYGGATALLDGINTGISLIKNKDGYDRKAVIILTDGRENSSIISEKKLLKRAIENNISIYTIGFGDYISDEYLEALSAYTGGSYYRIYSSRDLKWIFRDIYRKLNNYYAISFKLNSVGEHELILKICVDQSEPLVTTFNNTPLPPADSLDDADYELKTPHVDLIPDTFFVEMPGLKKTLDEREPVKVVNEDTLKIIDEFKRLRFPDIRFVFDKTVIVPGTDNGLQEVVDFLMKYPQTRIYITGHTDSLGTDAYNINLSIRRAEKIKSLIIAQGIEADRILIYGRGEKMPRVSNRDIRGRALNRRVEFRLILPQTTLHGRKKKS